jgi:hypothetical protein
MTYQEKVDCTSSTLTMCNVSVGTVGRFRQADVPGNGQGAPPAWVSCIAGEIVDLGEPQTIPGGHSGPPPDRTHSRFTPSLRHQSAGKRRPKITRSP